MTTTEKIVKQLLIQDEYDVQRLPFIIETLRIYLSNQSIVLQIQKKLKDNSINPSVIPSIFNIVVSSLFLFSKSLTLTPPDMKYLIYGLIYETILKVNPDFFSVEMDIPSFQFMYDSIYDVFMTVPTILNKVKTGCAC
jgi:hypothetical protein